MAQGQLFTRDFLERGIVETSLWQAIGDDQVNRFKASAASLFRSRKPDESINEANTEDKIIKPMIRALGWGDDYLSQIAAARKGRADIPDILLFPDSDACTTARKLAPADMYRHGICFVESKKWCRPLDRKDGKADDGVPSTQMLRYLNRVMVMSDSRILWGVLTNGRHWRLYWQNARSQSEEFLELDLPALLGLDGFTDDLFAPAPKDRIHWLKVFVLIFGRIGFLPGTDGRSFHRIALDEGKLWEDQVAQDLSDLVFNDVFPQLAQAIFATDPERPISLDRVYLDEVRQAVLILLYRLLFVLYAEDRNLLPVRDRRYDDYGMRKRVREDVRRRRDDGDVFADDRGDYYDHLRKLFRSIARGSKTLGLPPYNGGLFDEDRTKLLNRVELPDSVMADVIDVLSRPRGRWVNYRDLSVQQLGSIYERLLEHEIVADGASIRIRPNAFARKSSGSYYTPEDLVRLIIIRTVGPMIEERRQTFADRLSTLTSDRRPKKARIAELEALDPASAMLELKVCDPAMGSGHFLVSLVDYLADRVLEAVAEATELADKVGMLFESPLARRVAAIRLHIWEAAQANKWTIRPENLDDRLIVRRMILKRVIYGIDKNPMAVEADPSWVPAPQFWVSERNVNWPRGWGWLIGFKDVTAPTNMRTMIAAAIPAAGVGNTLPLLIPEIGKTTDLAKLKREAALWLANLNAMAFDFVARQKVQGQHLNWYIVEQLPVIPTAAYTRRIGKRTADDIVRKEVLRLTYTSHDMKPFAADQGYDGPPFAWDETTRRHAQARLDALYFMLYGLDEDNVEYVLSTFPIVRQQDEAVSGRFITRDLVVGYLRAFKASDPDTMVVV